MKKILAPIDFSLASEKTIFYIKEVFSDYSLTMLHVCQSGKTQQQAEESFKQFESKALKDTSLTYEFVIANGDTLLEEIQAVAKAIQPDYIMLGTIGTALTKALVKLTNCPVFVVPEANSRSGIKKIAYANDFHNLKNSDTLQPLMRLSRAFGAKVYIIHVNRGEPVTQDEAEASLEYYLEQIDHEYVHIPDKDIEKALSAYLAEKDIDLLTILLRDHGSNDLKSAGRLVEEIVSHARLPILNLV